MASLVKRILRKSTKFYSDFSCYICSKFLENFAMLKKECQVTTARFLDVARAGEAKELAFGNCQQYEMPSTRSGGKNG